MYVKLVNPKTKMVMAFTALGEVYYEPKPAWNYATQQEWIREYEAQNYDSRRFAIWEGDMEEKLAMSAIIVPGCLTGVRSQGVAILTNWDTWLTNDNGRSIDRIHRYRD